MDDEKQRSRICIVAPNKAIPRLLGLVRDGAVGGYAVGGIEVQVVALARALAGQGWDLTLLVDDCGQAASAEVDGIKVVRACRRSRGLLGRLGALLQLCRSVRDTGCDAYLVQGVGTAASLTAFVAKRLGRRLILWLASDTDVTCTDRHRSRVPFWQRRIAAYAFRTAHTIVAQTNHQRDLVQERFGRGSEVIHNLWPVSDLQPRRADKLLVLWVANLRWEKRPEMLLELAAAAPEINFVMVGGPMPQNEQIYDRVRREQEAYPNLEYVGFVPFEGVGPYFERAAVFLNTSVVEGFPNSFLQAWDAELPIVASFDPDGLLVREGLGYHCEAVGDFVSTLRMLLANPTLRTSIGERAKAYLRAHYGPEAVVPQLDRLLAHVTGGQ